MNIINAPNAATNSLADTLVLVETTNFIPRENTAFISFSQTSEFPKKGDSFTLEWLGYVIVFTFDSSKNELYFLPHYENGDKGTYIAIVTERLQQHDLVLDFFRIESNNNRIFFYFLNNEDFLFHQIR